MGKSFLICSLWLFSVCIYSQADPNTEIAEPKKIRVFPNPATDVVNILGLQNSDDANITISDVYGTEVLKHQWEIRKNALNIPVANLKKGIYIISIHSIEQKIQTKFYKN
ncbi:T9SS type A sorting domain-containing protein [Costertonia aggregata]|uniref:T9SS type A sorting domain-containing protein n=1 Tax=Costertonia aggregata TaxID=343403 RepID=A0A7H9AMS6_9FLAO|nr:T9SS type A sorting domain-containing protein [Costertonia aggregata]QLG44595.1 T9SS type A sorting domain-containing protein [Costertonia aggregata]